VTRITFTPSGKKRNAEGTGDIHITGYNVPLPSGLYFHRQWIDEAFVFHMVISDACWAGYDQKAIKIAYSEKEDWDLRIANNAKVPLGIDADVQFVFEKTAKKREWFFSIQLPIGTAIAA